MYLPKVEFQIAKRALFILPQPELNLFKSHLSINPKTTFFNVKVFVLDEALVLGPMLSAAMVGLIFRLLVKAGLKEALFLGWAGAISQDIAPGDVFLPKNALSRLGLTRELYPRRRIFSPDKDLTERLKVSLREAQLSFKEGRVLSTDYPFVFERDQGTLPRQRLQVLDMETAAFFGLAAHFGVSVAGLLLVTDRVGDLCFSLPRNLSQVRAKVFPLLKSFLRAGLAP